MFLGHYAAALGAKRIAPAASLGTLFAAAAFLDLVWPVLVIAGIERVAIADFFGPTALLILVPRQVSVPSANAAYRESSTGVTSLSSESSSRCNTRAPVMIAAKPAASGIGRPPTSR